MNRIELLQGLKKERDKLYSTRETNQQKYLSYAYNELYKDEPNLLRQTKSIAYALQHEPFYIYPEDRIFGRVYQPAKGSVLPFEAPCEGMPNMDILSRFEEEMKKDRELVAFNKYYNFYFGVCHLAWRWDILLEKGIRGYKEFVKKKYLTYETDPDKKTFYEGVVVALSGMENFVLRVCKELERLIENDPKNDNYPYMLENLKNTLYPAKNFATAVQCFMVSHICVQYEILGGGNSPGRIDKYLWPYLKEEYESGVLSKKEVEEIIAELLMVYDERLAPLDGWVETCIVGGTDREGNSLVSPLTYIIVETFMKLNQTHPAVYMSMPDNPSKEYLELAAKYIMKGGNRCQVFGDKAIQNALLKDGFDPKDVADYYAGGCMEIGVQGKQGEQHFSYAINVPLILETVLNGGVSFDGKWDFLGPRKNLCDYNTFEELYDAFEKEFIRIIHLMYRKLDIHCSFYKGLRPMHLISSLCPECMERGKSLQEGGAKYPNYGGSAVGIPNVGDSLYSIKVAVYEDKVLSKKQLLNALKTNFENCPEIRKYLLNIPKYGGGSEEATGLVNKVLEIHNKTAKSYKNVLGGHGVTVILGFTFNAEYGAQTGASADGRLKGQTFAQSLSPQNSGVVEGLTQAINDALSLSLDNVAGGASMMWDLDPNLVNQKNLEAIILSYVQKGGHIFQGNVINKKMLTDALENPEENQHIIVRVGGFSARFVTLSKACQKEIIERYEY